MSLDTAITESLANVVGADYVLTDPYDLDRYSADALTPVRAFTAAAAFERLADVVVRPSSAAEVVQILVLANEQKLPVIPYGGGTGVMGGALPVKGGIVLDLSRMNRILQVNSQDLTVEAEAGVVLEDLENTLAEHGLMPGHDPYSVAIATVGGAISTNGVGYRAAAHGPMGDQVVCLEAVLADGRVLTTRAVPKYSSGPGLNQLFIGTEGTFGVITKATLRVTRIPESQEIASVIFQDFAHGFQAAAEMLALGIRPTLLDLTEENDSIKLHLLFEGFSEGVTAHKERALRVCSQFEGQFVGTGPTVEYWQERHDSGYNYKKTSLGKPREIRWQRWNRRGFDYLHLALPISQVLEYRSLSETILKQHSYHGVEYAIWSRPEMFSMLIVPDDDSMEDIPARLSAVVDEVLRLAQDMGGIMEYCHGPGVKLNHLLAREMGEGHQITRQLKQALDPNNILNPGKLGL